MRLALPHDPPEYDDGRRGFVFNRNHDLGARCVLLSRLNEKATGRDVGDESRALLALNPIAAREAARMSSMLAQVNFFAGGHDNLIGSAKT